MKLENILFLDIETVPLHPNYNNLSVVGGKVTEIQVSLASSSSCS